MRFYGDGNEALHSMNTGKVCESAAAATADTTTTTAAAAAPATITSTVLIFFQRVLHQRFVQVLVLENTVGILMVTSLLVTTLLQMTQ
jgi:hypothetical protein